MKETGVIDVIWIREEKDTRSTQREVEVAREEAQAERDILGRPDQDYGDGVVDNTSGKTIMQETTDMASGRSKREMIGGDIGEIILVLMMNARVGIDIEAEEKTIGRETEVVTGMVDEAEWKLLAENQTDIKKKFLLEVVDHRMVLITDVVDLRANPVRILTQVIPAVTAHLMII